MIRSKRVEQADERIAPHIVCTLLTHDAARNLYIQSGRCAERRRGAA